MSVFVQALGDMVESIAAAVLIDTELDLDRVWRILEPILSPFATPDNLELPPWRELNELCDHLGYFIKEKCTTKGETVRAEVTVQLKDVLLSREANDRTKKDAKGEAARLLLTDLEVRLKTPFFLSIILFLFFYEWCIFNALSAG